MKGYPKSKFEIVNQSQIREITVADPIFPSPVVMATYTADKGTSEWELLTDFDDFTKNHGGLNFARHGQAQLTVIEALRNGAVVLGKRVVSNDSTLANATIRARIIKAGDNSFLYLYANSVSADDAISDADEIFKKALGDFDYDKTVATEITLPTADESEDPSPQNNATSIDIPLFSLAATGTGASSITFRVIPEYYASKSNNYLKYTIEIMENSTVLDSVIFSMNPDVTYDGVNQSLETKLNSVSGNVIAEVYEGGIYKLATELAKTATLSKAAVSASDLLNMDMINAYNKLGKISIGNIVTIDQATAAGADAEPSSVGALWTKYTPEDIKDKIVNLQGEVGVALDGGSYGTLGFDPSKNKAELEKLYLGAWGKSGTDHPMFDPIIYDLDAYKVDVIFDANFPMSVKNAIIDVLDFRGDAVLLADLGTTGLTTLQDIIDKKNGTTTVTGNNPGIQNSKFVTVYHNYFDIVDTYSSKQITVTMPYLLISRLLAHFDAGVGRPFAGMANQVTFPEIITKSVNFLPVVIPGEDQKQVLVDNNINYISYYDGLAVMETMYTNDDEYSQLSFLHNILSIQQVVKKLRTKCPKIRYTFIDGSDLEKYIDDCNTEINNYKSFFKSIEMTYMADDRYEENNIFYAVIKVTFKHFIQEEYFKVIALG